MANYISIFSDIIDYYPKHILKSDEKVFSHKPFQNKWSYQEIIGHLVDSALNNHQRFIRGQDQDNLIFQGYDQDYWVRLQNYQSYNLEKLVALWESSNHLLLHIFNSMPDENRYRLHNKHNFDKIAFRIISRDTPSNLDFLMEDYVCHLQHHLSIIPG